MNSKKNKGGNNGILCCWKCNSLMEFKEKIPAKKNKSGFFLCPKCGNKYTTEKGIVVAAKNDELEKLRKAKPNWYVTPQQKARDVYRHQHDKRRLLLKNSVLRILKKKKGEAVFLDIGCGDGINLKEMKEFSGRIRLYGSDYNSLRLLRAKKLVPDATLILADMNREVIMPGSCDILLLNHVLEHVKDDVGLLKKMHSYLKPGGYALIGIPQEGTFICKLRNYVLEPYMMFITDHVHFYTDGEIRKKIKAARFRVEEFVYLNYHFPHSVIDRQLRKSKRIHNFMERTGAKYFRVGGAGALWIVLRKPAEVEKP
jgi:2-polyprenyl-3-methyl-5-hydroxy-6-metoxy-1,4-benzoquinol methylase